MKDWFIDNGGAYSIYNSYHNYSLYICGKLVYKQRHMLKKVEKVGCWRKKEEIWPPKKHTHKL